MATTADDLTIAPGTPDDIDDVMQIMEAAFGDRFGEAWNRSQLSGILPMAGVSLIVARDGDSGSASGFYLSRSVADESELLLIAVLPSQHRRGIGRRLLEDFLDKARENGCRRVHLEVRAGNPAIGMYQAASFSPIGRRRNYYQAVDGKRFDAVTLARDL